MVDAWGSAYDRVSSRAQTPPPPDEEEFKKWYAGQAAKQGLNPDPDDPQHFYDYRAAFAAGAAPDDTGHWPSQFKTEGHPRMVLDGVNTKTGEPVQEKRTAPETEQPDPWGAAFDRVAPPPEKAWYESDAVKKAQGLVETANKYSPVPIIDPIKAATEIPKAISAIDVKDMTKRATEKFTSTWDDVGRFTANPAAWAEGVTEFITAGVPQFFTGALGYAQSLAKEVMDQAILGGEIDPEKLHQAATKGFEENSKWTAQNVPSYRPYYKESKVLGEALMAPGTAAKSIFESLADSDYVKSLPEEKQKEIKGLFGFAGDISELVVAAKSVHGAKEVMGKAAPKSGVPEKMSPAENVKLDNTFAKDEILTRIAQERANTPQRPLDRLSRVEETLAYDERPETKRAQQAAETFENAESVYGEKEEARYARMVDEVQSPVGREGLRGRLTELERQDAELEAAKNPDVLAIEARNARDAEIARQAALVGDKPGPNISSVEYPKEAPNRPIPEFKTTNEAVAFGEKASAGEVAELKRLEDAARAKEAEYKAAKDFSEDRTNNAYKAQLYREAQEAARREHPSQRDKRTPEQMMSEAYDRVTKPVEPAKAAAPEPNTGMRSVKDMLRDVNTAVGKTGSLGYDFLTMTPERRAAYDRLAKDILMVKRNAGRVGKDVGEYLTSMGVDRQVIDAITQNYGGVVDHAAAVYGQQILDKTENPPAPRDGKYAGSVNLDKQNIPQSAKDLELAIAKEKQTITHKQTEARSDKILISPNRMESALQDLQKMSGGNLTAKMDAVGEINATAMKMFGGVLDDFRKGKIGIDEFNQKFTGFREGILDITSGAKSEVGRALEIQKKYVSGDRIADILNRFKKLSPRQIEDAQRVLRRLEEGTLTKDILDRFEKEMPDPKFADYLVEFWYNNVLSGPPTHLVNVAGNTSWITWQLPHRALTAPIDKIWSTFTGAQRQRYLDEIVPMMAGMGTGFVKGRGAAAEMMKRGRVDSYETKWTNDMGASASAFARSPHKILRTLAPYLTVATRGLQAMDVWANSIAFDAQVNALARRAANQRGLKGDQRAQFEKNFAENLSGADLESAKRFSRYSTFTDPPDPFTNLLAKAREVPVVGTLLKMTIMPFVNTISNLLKRGVEMTPGLGLVKEAASWGMKRGIEGMEPGVVKALGKDWAAHKKYVPAEIIAKQIEGAIIAYFVLNAAQQGIITGPLPENKAERDAWYRQGKKPWSLRRGNEKDGYTWHEFRRMEPFNTGIAAATTFYDKIINAPDEKKATEAFMDFALMMKDNLLDGAYFAGLQNVLDRYDRRQSAIPRFAMGWIPYSGFLSSTSRAYEVLTEGEAKPREGNEWIKALARTIPGVSGTLPAQLDVYGKDSVIPGGVFRQWLPFKWAKETNDPVELELEKLGFYPALPEETVSAHSNEYQIPEDMYRSYAIDYGTQLKAEFEDLISRKAWPEWSDEEKYRLLEKVKSRTHTIATRTLLGEMQDRDMLTEQNIVKKKKGPRSSE